MIDLHCLRCFRACWDVMFHFVDPNSFHCFLLGIAWRDFYQWLQIIWKSLFRPFCILLDTSSSCKWPMGLVHCQELLVVFDPQILSYCGDLSFSAFSFLPSFPFLTKKTGLPSDHCRLLCIDAKVVRHAFHALRCDIESPISSFAYSKRNVHKSLSLLGFRKTFLPALIRMDEQAIWYEFRLCSVVLF